MLHPKIMKALWYLRKKEQVKHLANAKQTEPKGFEVSAQTSVHVYVCVCIYNAHKYICIYINNEQNINFPALFLQPMHA